MPVQTWSESVGKEWGNGSKIARDTKKVVAAMKKFEAQLDKMSKADLEKLLDMHNKELAAAKAQRDKIGDLRVAWFRYADAAKKKDLDEAEKKAAALIRDLMAPVEAAYSTGSRDSTDCSAAADNLHFYLNEFTPKIEKALKAKK